MVYPPRMVAPKDAKSDIALLRRGLETIHPGLYRYTRKAEIDAAFAQLESVANAPVSKLALHREMALRLATAEGAAQSFGRPGTDVCLEKRTQTKDEVLAELMAEHVTLRSRLGNSTFRQAPPPPWNCGAVLARFLAK